MEDLLSNLTEVAVTEHPNTPYAEHPYFSLYKVKRSGSSQDERRKRVLEARKEARYDLLNHLRNIEEENAATESSSSDDSMEYEKERVCYKKPKKYRNFLMLSEWLVDVPEDFATSYLSVLCPVGKRTLIVSARGRTRAYTKSGIMVNQFPSLLPGGCYHSKRKGYALLDCIWSITEKTFFVLDLVVWLNQSIMECETQFRFEWLKSRMLEETPDAAEISQYNPYKFVTLPYYDCTTETLTRLVNEPLPFPVPLDGILFYHKESHYTHGPTPLVGWLKAYMFPEILGINQVAQVHMSERPARYISLPAHIQYGKDKQQQKQEALKNKMDVSAENIKSTRENGKKVQEVRKNEGDSIDTMMEVSAERKKSPREKSKKDQGVRENEGNSIDTMMEVSSQKKKKPKEKKKKSKDSQESQMETMVT
ncbi:snurportin-1-like isoform X2 [Penaeus japonicus]|uniref:snurportin-1-like isoform X2 n=1 Tax=Penaeus japonicus TaxID=27405 RepID=UPI001C714FDB|nr:snurportin-1-like isoform X2 [Penaeus japonicus]